MVRKLLLLVVAAIIITAMVVPGCTPPTTYTLTMAEDPAGGGTATDLTGSSPYAADTVVRIEAVAAAGYQFVNWTAPAGTFVDENAATTSFNMPPQDVTVTANFGRVYDLTMAVSPLGAGTTTPAATTPQGAGTDVSIQAAPNLGYQFVNWSAPAGSFADASAATTVFTMPAEDVTVTANFVLVFDLTMTVSPAGAGTTNPTGTTQQGAGTGVNIQATPGASYQFAYWSAPAGSFADASAAATVFTMPAEDVTVTAHFVGPLDHSTLYFVDYLTAPVIDEPVILEDQFGTFEAQVLDAAWFFNPTEKVHDTVTTPIYNPDHHHTIYQIEYLEEPGTWNVEIENQFGLQLLTVQGPIALAVPTQKDDHEPPVHLDHYLFYWVTEGPYIEEYVYLQDQFGDHPEVMVYDPVLFANPVKKTHGDIVFDVFNPDDHVVIYATTEGSIETTVHVANQFGDQILDVYGPLGLAVPSQKLDFAPAVGHFYAYKSLGPVTSVGADVTLEDQFGTFDAVVDMPLWFCNPTEKWHMDAWSPMVDPDHHLTVYSIDLTIGEPKEWAVGVSNQFGEDQNLTVFGPIALAVPTHKLFPGEHEPPVDLGHYLIYEVVSGPSMDAFVELLDEFGPDSGTVTIPRYFANPVKKTHDTHTDEIINDFTHLVFYEIVDTEAYWLEVGINNQFVADGVLQELAAAYLAVPSLKLYVDPMF